MATKQREEGRGRYSHAKAILGPELSARLPDTKVLLVGAGGIGCELRTSSASQLCLFSLRLTLVVVFSSIHIYCSEEYCVNRLWAYHALGLGHH